MKYLIRKPDTLMSNINDEINSILRRSFDTVFPEYVLEREMKGLSLPVDIQEFDNDYKVKVEMPGIKKEDVDIELKKYHKTEFRYGNYSRTVYFPHEINVNEADAKVENGVLVLDLPKLKKADEETKKLEVK